VLSPYAAVMYGAQAIMCGSSDVVVAGGMENMSQVPHYVSGMRGGVKMGHQEMVDGMIKDGLWDVYGDEHMVRGWVDGWALDWIVSLLDAHSGCRTGRVGRVVC
jgi:acetyl-CoA acetyltransferase